jgi:hypothetical protein
MSYQPSPQSTHCGFQYYVLVDESIAIAAAGMLESDHCSAAKLLKFQTRPSRLCHWQCRLGTQPPRQVSPPAHAVPHLLKARLDGHQSSGSAGSMQQEQSTLECTLLGCSVLCS